MGGKVEEKKAGPPAYMVSFGDMMTLILTFFILLVSMAKDQAPGLVADGIGSFIVQLETHGLNGMLSGQEKNAIFNRVRHRFGLPPRPDDTEPAHYDDSSAAELLRTKAAEALQPHAEVAQPNLAIFEPGSSTLAYEGRRFLDQLASTLRPREGQLLVLEGHAADSGGLDPMADRRLAHERARAVRKFLLESHGYVDTRVEARAWLQEVHGPDDRTTRAVHGRLVTPTQATD